MRLVICLLILIIVPLALAVMWQPPTPRADLTTAYIAVQTLDPSQMQASEDIRMGYALFEGLTTFDPYHFEVLPGVAERWDVSADQLTYTFHLRSDARWSNGQPVTSHDFAATWQQGMLPDFAGPYHKFLRHIRGARAFSEWAGESLKQVSAIENDEAQREAGEKRLRDVSVKFKQLVGVQVVDDRTLVVQLERSTPYFLEVVACWPLFPLHRSVIDSTKLDDQTWMLRRDPQWTRAGRMISNGPYRLAQWQFKRQIVLERSTQYWNKDQVKLNRVAALNFANPVAAFNAYESGAIDLVVGIAVPFRAELVAAARDGRRPDIHPVNNWGTYYYTFNCRPTLPDGEPNPFADPRVRKAFALTIDKQRIVEHVTREFQQVAHTFIPPNSIAGYTAPDGLVGTAEDAPRLLADAGYPNGDGMPTVVLMYNSGGGHENTALAIARMWEQTLGVKVTMDVNEWKVFQDELAKGNFMAARVGWFGDYGDPTTFLDLCQTGNGNNDAAFSDPHYDGLLAQAAQESDATKRLAILAEAERYILQDQVPIVPLYYYRLIHAFNADRVQGVSLHPRNLQFFHRMEVRE